MNFEEAKEKGLKELGLTNPTEPEKRKRVKFTRGMRENEIFSRVIALMKQEDEEKKKSEQ